MRASVLQAFPGFSTRFEGRLTKPYTDVKGLVTTGIGNLIDPIAVALPLPWRRDSDGALASRAEVEGDWHKIKDAWPGVQSVASTRLSTLHLDPADVDYLVSAKAHANDETLRQQFPGYDDWPADAQLAIHSMAWAQGPSFHGWPHLLSALNASPPDFMTAAGPPGDATDPSKRGAAWMNDAGNPGLRPRNLATKILWQNAARVVAGGMDPELLYYPAELVEGAMGPARGGGAWRAAGEVALLVLVLGGVGWGVLSFTGPGKTFAKGHPWAGKLVRA